MPATRSDLHRPVMLITEDYDFVGAFDNQHDGSEFRRELARLVRDTSPLNERGTSQCHHCGAWMRYVAVLVHRPTGEHIAVGETCLDNRFDRSTSEFHALREAAALDRAKQRIKTAVAAFCDANPDLAFMADKDHAHTNDFVADVARKLRQYGELSERQVAAVRSSIVRDAQRAAERAAEATLPTVDCPEGKVTVTGEVVSLKWTDGDYGSTLKMTVRDDRGFKVWVTVPSTLPNTERGDRVTFSATITRSDRDASFGFGKRPTRAALISQEAAA